MENQLASTVVPTNIIRNSLGATRYIKIKITYEKSVMEAIFNSTIENATIKMTNNEGQQVYDIKIWKRVTVSFQTNIQMFL